MAYIVASFAFCHFPAGLRSGNTVAKCSSSAGCSSRATIAAQ